MQVKVFCITDSVPLCYFWRNTGLISTNGSKMVRPEQHLFEGITYLSKNDEEWFKQKEINAPSSPTFLREDIPLDPKLKDFIEPIWC